MMEISIDAMQQNDKSKKVMEIFIVGAMQQNDKSKGSSPRHPDFLKPPFYLCPATKHVTTLLLGWHSDLWKMSLLNAPTILSPFAPEPHSGDENSKSAVLKCYFQPLFQKLILSQASPGSTVRRQYISSIPAVPSSALHRV
jgi:hypothetical protein